MTTRASLGTALGLALAASVAVSTQHLVASPGAAALAAPAGVRIVSASTTPTSLDSGTLHLSVLGEGARLFRVSATCPRQVYLKTSGKNLCGSSHDMSDEQVDRLMLTLRNPTHATGSLAIAVQIVDPELPVSTSTRQVVTLTLPGKK